MIVYFHLQRVPPLFRCYPALHLRRAQHIRLVELGTKAEEDKLPVTRLYGQRDRGMERPHPGGFHRLGQRHEGHTNADFPIRMRSLQVSTALVAQFSLARKSWTTDHLDHCGYRGTPHLHAKGAVFDFRLLYGVVPVTLYQRWRTEAIDGMTGSNSLTLSLAVRHSLSLLH